MTRKERVQEVTDILESYGFKLIPNTKYIFEKGIDTFKICVSCSFKIKHYKQNVLMKTVSRSTLSSYLNRNFTK